MRMTKGSSCELRQSIRHVKHRRPGSTTEVLRSRNCPELEVDLIGREFGFSDKNENRIQLERKEDTKRRRLASPDLGDCLAMTFAVDIAFRSQRPSQLVYYFPGPNARIGCADNLPSLTKITTSAWTCAAVKPARSGKRSCPQLLVVAT